MELINTYYVRKEKLHVTIYVWMDLTKLGITWSYKP